MPTIRDKLTGETFYVPDEPASPRGIPIGPQDPTMDYKAPHAAADASRAQTQASIARQTAQAEIARAQAEAVKAQADAAKAQMDAANNNSAPRLTPGQSKVDQNYAQEYVDWRAAGGAAGLNNNLKLLGDAIDVLDGSDTITGPVYGRLPKFIQQMVDPRGPNVRADVERVIQQSLKAILGGQFAQKEAEQLFARSFDPTQQEQFNSARVRSTLNELRQRGDAKEAAARYYEQHGTLSGWEPQPVPQQQTPWGQAYVAQGGGQQAAPFGATEASGSYPPEFLSAHRDFIAQNAGRMTADDYVRFRMELDKQFGFGSDPDQYRAWGEDAVRRAQGGTISSDVAPPNRSLSTYEQLRNNAANNPATAAFAGFGDAFTMGIPTALAPGQMGALGDARPLSTTLGQIGGAIAGTRVLGMGLETLARGAPQLVRTGANAMGRANNPFTRSLGVDTLYSGGYGAVTGQDPLTSAALGAAGSVAGQTLGAGVGKAISGARLSPQVQALRARGIPLTIGQQFGGTAKGIEDAWTSIPGIGDLVNARRAEGVSAFNRRAFQEAGAPIGATVNDVGETGVESLRNQIGAAYDRATAGVDIPLDSQFMTDLRRVTRASRNLPPDLATRFTTAMDNRVNPIAQAGRMTGDQYQQSVRGLKGYRAEHTKPGFEQDYRDALSRAQDAVTGQMKRGGGAKVVGDLAKADNAYRNMKVLEKAVAAAKNSEGQTFIPSQLNNAAQQSKNKFGGQRPLKDLIDAGQAVLPSRLADSGTAKRLAVAAGGGALTGGAAGFAAGGMDGAATGAAAAPLATGVLLALGGTKGGQKALQTVLIDRPDILKRLGLGVNKRKSIWGSASLPLLLSE